MPLNLPCYEICVATCESLLWETGPLGVITCVIGCAVACNTDTLSASADSIVIWDNSLGQPPPFDPESWYWA